MATQPDDMLDDGYEEDAPDLDLDAEDDTDASEGGDEPVAGGDHPDDDGDEADHIAFGGDDPITGEDEPEGVRNLRARLKEIERENRALKAASAPPAEELGPKPSRDDYWDREEEEYDRDLLAWQERKAEAEKGQRERQELNATVEREIADSAAVFERQRASLRVPNFDGAYDRVKERVGEAGERILSIVAGEKSAALAYALGNSEERLEALGKFNLNKITDLVRYAAEIGSMAKVVEVRQGGRKPATQPESVQRGGGAPPRGDARRAALEKEADATGDDSKLIRYDYNQRNKNRG